MNRHVISILVSNHAGVLSRITGLFSRRCFNIDSLSVGVTADPDFSRITVVAFGDDAIIDQIRKQLEKLIDVQEVIELHQEDSVYRELALVKIGADAKVRPEIVSIAEIFRASVIDVSTSTITVEMTGDQSKIDACIQLLSPYGVKEIVRTGLAGIQRGCSVMEAKNGGYYDDLAY
ncbi:MAG: acetolactate synthase small subunit [Clostridiales bacterium]|jgi:acetolactate synthase-1/3 small subunit|nr:acetolactate synthase small subunit [Clostridiales bacterium]